MNLVINGATEEEAATFIKVNIQFIKMQITINGIVPDLIFRIERVISW